MLDRRNFLNSAVSVAGFGAGALPPSAGPLAFSDHDDWRAYEIRTIVEIDSTERTQVWVPAASFADSLWSRPLGTHWTGNGSAELVHDPVYGAEIVRLEWRSGSERRAEIVSRIARATARWTSMRAAARSRRFRVKSALSSPTQPYLSQPTGSSKKPPTESLRARAATSRRRRRSTP